MRSIARDGSHELEIQRSRFLCSLARASTTEQATAFIAAIRKERWSATHNCSAFRIGRCGQQQRSSDDGEPAGTAGVPILEVLGRRGITDTVAVVTRYFGGIKLGAGGLVRAYSRSVAEAIDAVGTVRRAPHTVIDVTVDHIDAGKLDNELRGAGYAIAGVDYGSQVHLTLHVATAESSACQTWLAEHTGGRASTRLGEEILLDVPE